MSNTMSDKNSVNFTRREFLGTVAAAAAFTIVPRPFWVTGLYGT